MSEFSFDLSWSSKVILTVQLDCLYHFDLPISGTLAISVALLRCTATSSTRIYIARLCSFTPSFILCLYILNTIAVSRIMSQYFTALSKISRSVSHNRDKEIRILHCACVTSDILIHFFSYDGVMVVFVSSLASVTLIRQ